MQGQHGEASNPAHWSEAEDEKSEQHTIPTNPEGDPRYQDKGKGRAFHPDSGDIAAPYSVSHRPAPWGIILPTEPNPSYPLSLESTGEGIVQAAAEVRRITGPRPPVAPPPPWPAMPSANSATGATIGSSSANRDPDYSQPQVEMKYDPNHRRWYRQRYDMSTNIQNTDSMSHDISPLIDPDYEMAGVPGSQSGYNTSYLYSSYAGKHGPAHPTPRFPRGEGKLLQGTWMFDPSTLHYETVDSTYYVRERSFFIEGRVFAVILNEAAGETSADPTDYNSSISLVRYEGNYIHTQTRRFVVVRQKREFCFACPIFTYSGRATTKPGAIPSEHGIIFSTGSEPRYVQGESGITKPSIGVDMAAGLPTLHPASRVYYGIHHPIKYNVKVKDMGMVPKSHIPSLLGNWKEEAEGMTQSLISEDNAEQR